MTDLTVVMYHYVRPIKESKYPNIKGLELDLFLKQINYLKNNYNFTTIEEILYCKFNNKQLPRNSVLLTFDDGYIDHYEYVFPILKQNNIQGCFYIPFQSLYENKTLDVNKIHFILEKVSNIELLIEDLKILIKQEKLDTSFDDYFAKYAIANRFDSKEVIFIKRLLQIGIDNFDVRNKILNYLFEKYVTDSEKDFSKELYMNEDMILEMLDNGMHIGNHGYQHFWWDKIDLSLLNSEIAKSTKILNDLLNISNNNKKHILSCAYPYGGYNKNVLDVMKSFNYDIAFTTIPNTANLQKINMLEIPRLDTNDIPKE